MESIGDICQKCRDKTEHSIDNLFQVNKELQSEIVRLQQENELLKQPQESEAVKTLLDMFEPEKLVNNGPNLQSKAKITTICGLISEIKNITLEQSGGIYFDYDTAIDLLEKVKGTMIESMRCPKPKDLPNNLPWCESMNMNEEFDPYVYKGDMSVDDFRKAQKYYFKSNEKRR
ncbi:MAG: hypothetical protein ABFD18_06450 [Syntrophomonas sp.]